MSPVAPMPILVISTTNRPASLTVTVAKYYLACLQEAHIPAELLSLTDLPKDFTASALYANKGKNTFFNKMTKLLDRYTKYVFIIPQYNGSFPGVFKAFIDGYAAPHIFQGKKAALVGVSRGMQGGLLGLSHVTDILIYLGMVVYPIQPKLANIPDPSWQTLQQFPDYLTRLQKQAIAFSTF